MVNASDFASSIEANEIECGKSAMPSFGFELLSFRNVDVISRLIKIERM